MKVNHILFDNDGTLVDTEIICINVMLELLRPLGFTMGHQEYSHRFPGLLEHQILEIIGREHNIEINEGFVETLKSKSNHAFNNELKAIPGMTSLFRELKVPKSMVSNASAEHVERCLRKIRLFNKFDGQIFSANHVSRAKPFPDVYLHALDTLKLKSTEAIVVEDSPVGVAAGKAAGLRVVGFLGAAHIMDGHDQKLKKEGADYIAKDAKDLRAILHKYGAL